jgi:hypothetical protein
MAKRGSRGGVKVQKAPGTSVVVVPSAPAPVRRRSRGGRSIAKRSRRKGRVGKYFASKYNLQNSMMTLAAGGAIIGFVEKHFGANIPELPLVGRKGAIALAVLLLKPKNAWLQDAGKAAAAISGYELGSTGKVTGDVASSAY